MPLPQPVARSARLSLAALLLLCAAPACTTYSSRLAAFRNAYGSGDFAAAEEEIDSLIADETGIDEEVVARSKARDPSIQVTKGDAPLLLLEKAMTRWVQGDPSSAIALLRTTRDELDQRAVDNVGVTVSKMAASVRDDTSLPYVGADYEHLVVRVMLCLVDLLEGGEDAYAYAVQIGEKQEQIITSAYGDVEGGEGYRPREQYRRLAVGAFLQGVILESQLQPEAASRRYQQAAEFAGNSDIIGKALLRAREGNYCKEGDGVVHVFYLGGRGPHLVEGTHGPTAMAMRLAGIMMAIMARSPSLIAQRPVQVPVVTVNDGRLAGLRIAHGDLTVRTETLLDVNVVAQQELQANMPWIIARALVRRAIKEAASQGVREGVKHASGSRGWGMVASMLFSFFITAIENADTRNWTSLPAQLQTARLEIPAGEQILHVGDQTVPVRVTKGRDSYVIVIQPHIGRPGTIMVDRYSQPLPAPEPLPMPEVVP